jgi:hypothetical protein
LIFWNSSVLAWTRVMILIMRITPTFVVQRQQRDSYRA